MKYNKKTNQSKKQKIYKMKGCSKKTRKNHLGGYNPSLLADYGLAYPGNDVKFVPNPHLAYTGKGGKSNLACSDGLTQAPFAYTGNTNTNASNPAYPSTGPQAASQNWLGSQQNGGCNCGLNFLVKGGSSSSHRASCKCSMCKNKRNSQKGGNGLPYGQGLPEMSGSPYPNGLVGAPWKPPIPDWPGVNGISGDHNHLSHNTYSPNDVSRQMVSTGANPPFSIGGGKKKAKKGGDFSNFLQQDFVNLGRQLQFNMGSAYNAINGYQAPVNPLPWKDQLVPVNSTRS